MATIMHATLLRSPFSIAPSGLAALTGLTLVFVWPEQVDPALLALALLTGLVLALLCPTAALVAWLFAVGLTPDMWLPGASGMAVIAGLKLAGLGLVAVAALRFGVRWDGFNPGFAFLAMFCWSVLHGLHPNLDWAESARSLLGSVAPFAVGFVRLSGATARALIRAVMIVPFAAVLAGVTLTVPGIHPMIVDSAGLRLQGAGHPAFLAGFAMAASYAALLEFMREGKIWYGAMVMLNLGILALTGARAPLAIAVLVISLAVACVPSPHLPWSMRVPLLLAGAILVVLLPLMAGFFSDMRLFNLLLREPTNLSGRDEIWPYFQAAWDASPWFGWGVGAAKSLVDLDSPVARLLGTNAAHNEYLRIGMEGGYFGLLLLILYLVLWTRGHLRATCGPDRAFLLLVLIGFAVHSYTDNTLIATTSSVFLTWINACFARSARENATPRQN